MDCTSVLPKSRILLGRIGQGGRAQFGRQGRRFCGTARFRRKQLHQSAPPQLLQDRFGELPGQCFVDQLGELGPSGCRSKGRSSGRPLVDKYRVFLLHKLKMPLTLRVLPRFFACAIRAFGASGQNGFALPAIEARCQPDFFVDWTRPERRFPGQRSARRRTNSTRTRDSSSVLLNANADTNIDDRIERGR